MKRIAVVSAVLVFTLIPAASADAVVASAAGMSVFRDTPAKETRFAIDSDGSTTVRAWTIVRGSFAGHISSFIVVKMGTAPARRLTARRSGASLGGLDLNNSRGELIAYELTPAGGDFDIRLFDLAAEHRIALPSGIDTRMNELGPTVSGNWLLFTRVSNSTESSHVVLAKLDGTDTRAIADAAIDSSASAQQVNGDWVVYTVCRGSLNPPFSCRVHRYQISTRTDVALPNGPNHDAENASVTSDGTVYYVEFGHRTARLVRWTLGGSAVLRRFVKNVYATDPWAYERPGGGGVTLFFVRRVFGGDRSGIYYISV